MRSGQKIEGLSGKGFMKGLVVRARVAEIDQSVYLRGVSIESKSEERSMREWRDCS